MGHETRVKMGMILVVFLGFYNCIFQVLPSVRLHENPDLSMYKAWLVKQLRFR
jgi:hypothetical protein